MTSFSTGVKYAGSRLFLYGENLNPEEIDRKTSLLSDDSYKKGEKIKSANNVRKGGMWSIAGMHDKESISKDLDYFIEKMNDSSMPLSKLPGVDIARISIWIDEFNPENSLEILFDIEDLSKISSLGAQIYITSFKQFLEK